MSFSDILRKLLHIVIVASAVLPGVGALMVWAERRVSAFMQDRLGPNRVGPAGLLQPVADLLKFIFKEDVIPGHVNRPLYVVAPALSPSPRSSPSAWCPTRAAWRSRTSTSGSCSSSPSPRSPSTAVSIGGWAGNSKYSLLGGVRSSAQMISYEIALGLSVVPVFLVVGDLNLERIVAWQKENVWLVIPLFPAWLIFLISSYAETNRLPFDLPEAEQELVAGYHTEYSSMKFALFFLAEYIHMITASALSVTLFFGGYELPFVTLPAGTWGTVLSGLIC